MSDYRIDYYQVLGVDASATEAQIRNAYKRCALKCHPDRVAQNSPDRSKMTRQFQLVNDAYYTLSDPRRRKQWETARGSHSGDSNSTAGSGSGPSSFDWSKQFGDAFEEMLREEGMKSDGTDVEEEKRKSSSIYSVLGALSGASLGFIIANAPGALIGAYAGNRLGHVRDTKGKSVYDAFQELPQESKARVLAMLATRVLRHTMS